MGGGTGTGALPQVSVPCDSCDGHTIYKVVDPSSVDDLNWSEQDGAEYIIDPGPPVWTGRSWLGGLRLIRVEIDGTSRTSHIDTSPDGTDLEAYRSEMEATGRWVRGGCQKCLTVEEGR